MTKRLGLAALVILGVATACSVTSQLGRPCTLYKATPDGGLTPLLPTDVTPDGHHDIFTSGDTECEDQLCVLDAAAVPGAYQQALSSTNHVLLGYCTKFCTRGSNSDCSKQYQDKQNVAGDQMTCQPFLLDQSAINAICSTPQECQRLLGGGQSPYLCARGVTASANSDGGS